MSLFGRRKEGESEPVAPPPPRNPTVGQGGPEPAARQRTTMKTPVKGEDSMANIGKSISIKGDLTGEEDVMVEGKVEGKVDLPQNELTIGANGNVTADVHAKTVMVIGRVAGNVSGAER
ncbi:MAG: polymer-forming cytoskeletal protein, partial [Thermoanaerobaculia bacterium]|nr:polymer-forming cytoskeletal protein [Thermoanaerobaculia bacterium]